MKKILLMTALFAIALMGHASAQRITLENVMVSSIRLQEGANTVQIPNGRGTLRFMKRGSTFSNVVLVDVAGKVIRLTPADDTGGAPKPVCQCPLPDACFSTEDKNIGMCICKACDLTLPENVFNVGLLLPAVQSAREAALRSN